jgi:hypothetical protein
LIQAYQVFYCIEVARWRRIAAVILAPLSLAAAAIQFAALSIAHFQGTSIRVFFSQQSASNLFSAEIRAALSLEIVVQSSLLFICVFQLFIPSNRLALFFFGLSTGFSVIQYSLSLTNLNPATLVAIKFLSLLNFGALAIHAFLIHRQDAYLIARKEWAAKAGPVQIRPYASSG